MGLSSGSGRPTATTGSSGTYTGGASVTLGGMTFAYVIPLGLFIAVTFGANVSGACFNPAVTLAVELRSAAKTNWAGVMMYFWLPQCLGAMAGRFAASIILPGSITGRGILDGVYLMP